VPLSAEEVWASQRYFFLSLEMKYFVDSLKGRSLSSMEMEKNTVTERETLLEE